MMVSRPLRAQWGPKPGREVQQYLVTACSIKACTMKVRENEEAIALVTRHTCKITHPFSEEMTKRYSPFGFAKETRAKPKLLKACSRTTERRECLNLVLWLDPKGSQPRPTSQACQGLPAECSMHPYLPTAPALVVRPPPQGCPPSSKRRTPAWLRGAAWYPLSLRVRPGFARARTHARTPQPFP